MNLFFIILFSLFAMAAPKEKSSKNILASVEEAAKKIIQKDLKVNVVLVHNGTVCGSEPGDIVRAEVMLKRANFDEKGKPRDRWDAIETFSATVKDFEKLGEKALVKEDQCQE